MQTDQKSAEFDAGNAPDIVLGFLNALGQLINSISLYGVEHKIAQHYFSHAYESLSTALATRKAIRFAFQDDQFFVDDKLIEDGTSFINLVRRKLQNMEITAFSLTRGVSEDELRKVAQVLADGKGSILDGKPGHIQPETSHYTRVGESDVVINKKTASAAAAAGGGVKRASDGAFEIAAEDAAPADKSAAGVQQIIAFLKGDVGTLSEATARSIQNAATDVDKLGQLIMESAAVRQRDPLTPQGESLADIVVGCLRRTFDGLNKAPAVSKDPVSIKKTMLMLEKNVLERLQRASAYDGNAQEIVTGAVDAMVEDLTIEAVSKTYAKQRAVADANSARLAGYMRAQSPEKLEALKAHLLANGVTPEGWQELVVKSGVHAASGLGGDGARSANTGLAALGALLARLDQLMSAQQLHSPDAQRAIAQVHQEVKGVAASAAGKIRDLENAVIQSSAGMDNPSENWRRQAAMSYVRTMEIIVEIVQEFSQSLAAMNCAVTMTLQERIGPLAETQKNILQLAADSGENLDGLFQRLLTVAGLPKTLHPDKESVYENPGVAP